MNLLTRLKSKVNALREWWRKLNSRPNSTIQGGGDETEPEPEAEVLVENKTKLQTGGTVAMDSQYFQDTRDGKRYRIVKMPDGKIWMAENLNYTLDGSCCLNDDEAIGEKYGRLYNWYAAMVASPPGWHVPSRQEWDGLCKAVGGRYLGHQGNNLNYWAHAGMKLKARKGWFDNNRSSYGNGTDEYGFSALPGGERKCRGKYGNVNGGAGSYGNWWTSTEENNDRADVLNMTAKQDGVGKYHEPYFTRKIACYSVRCVKDD